MVWTRVSRFDRNIIKTDRKLQRRRNSRHTILPNEVIQFLAVKAIIVVRTCEHTRFVPDFHIGVQCFESSQKRLDHSQTPAPESDPYGLRSLCKTLMLRNNFAMMMMRRRSHLPHATQYSRSSKLVGCESELPNPSDEKTPV